jgi:KDO2-lipid IV(A) lauroyltransferase
MHLLAYLGLRAGLGLVGLLPLKVARTIGTFFGGVWYRVDKDRSGMSRSHMRRVLGDVPEADEAAEAAMRSYGRYFAEALWVNGERVADMLSKTTSDGLERVIEARDEGNGMIYALPHMGNWEAAAPVAVHEGIPVVAVAEDLSNKRITTWFTEMRADFGIEIVLATGRIEVMRKLEAAIAANKAVALLSDRDLSRRGVEVEFFGEKTTLPPGPASLAIKTGAPLFPVGTYFREDGHHVVIRPRLSIPEVESRSEQIKLLTQEMAGELEGLIRRAPDQWHLLQPNWPSDREGS